MKKLLVDGGFTPIKMKLTESKGGDYFTGEFGKADVPTENRRIYPKRIWEREIKRIQPALAEGKVLAELDHPADGKTSLKRVSHVVKKLWMEPDGRIMGEATICDNEHGKQLKSILKAGGAVGVSSRGMGSTQTNEDGMDVVGEDFEYITHDCVADPAVVTSYPTYEFQESKNKNSNLGEENMDGKANVIEKVVDKNAGDDGTFKVPWLKEPITEKQFDEIADAYKDFVPAKVRWFDEKGGEGTVRLSSGPLKDFTVKVHGSAFGGDINFGRDTDFEATKGLDVLVKLLVDTDYLQVDKMKKADKVEAVIEAKGEVTLDQVRKAMELAKGDVGKLPIHGSVENQLAHSLKVYQDRGEYDGTEESAIDCLLQARYEIEGHKQKDESVVENTQVTPVVDITMKSTQLDGEKDMDKKPEMESVEVKELKTQLAEAKAKLLVSEGNYKELSEKFEKVVGVAKKVAMQLEMKEKLDGVSESVKKEIGPLSKYKSISELSESIKKATIANAKRIAEAHARKKEMATLSEAKDTENRKLRMEVTKRDRALEEALSLAKKFGLKSYVESQTKNHPNGDKIRELCEGISEKSKIDEVVRKFSVGSDSQSSYNSIRRTLESRGLPKEKLLSENVVEKHLKETNGNSKKPMLEGVDAEINSVLVGSTFNDVAAIR